MIIKINLVEVASELATNEMTSKYALEGKEEDLMEELSEGVLTWKEEYQDEFNEWYDYFYNEIDKLKIKE